jgi:hypothetical protein
VLKANPSSKPATLREALLSKLGTKNRFRLRDLRVGVRRRFGPMSLQDCDGVLAHERGIPIHRYLEGEDLERVRRTIASESKPAAMRQRNVKKTAKRQVSLKEIVIDGAAAKMEDPILPGAVIADAVRMARVYPLTYVFENSVRELIVRVMKKNYGNHWWKAPMVPGSVLRDAAKTREKEKGVPWHGERGTHQIHYTTIDNLLSIITSNENWKLFAPILGEQNGVQYLIQIIELSRHTIAHHNPLATEDIDRLKLDITAWQRMLQRNRDLIPNIDTDGSK